MNEFLPVLLSLALGLLVGLERGWKEVIEADSYPFLGLRTFGLTGLLGGIIGIISSGNIIVCGIAFAAYAALMIAVFMGNCGRPHGVGLTTVVAAQITFSLGMLVTMGYMQIASSAAVITAIVLSMKPVINEWIRKLEAKELNAALKLLLISVVMLPVLPNEGFGPFQALNPYDIWLYVVLITGISFVGYFAMKIAGGGTGIMLTGLLGGLVSSTALTLSFSRLGKHSQLKRVFTAGILVACGTMIPRMVIVLSVINPELLKLVLLPLIVTGIIIYGGTAFFWFTRLKDKEVKADVPNLANPFQIKPALKFAALISAIMFCSHFIKEALGDVGVIALAFVSGFADVDAVTISMAKLSGINISQTTAAAAIMTAAYTNTIVKGLMVFFISNRIIGFRVMSVFVTGVVAGLAVFFLGL
jgi:uncharacterized membrane protein (DUF4010 family)